MRILSYIKKHSVITSIILVVVVVAAIVMGRNSVKDQAISTADNSKKVTLVSVETFRLGNDFVSANGIVMTKGQADLKSQSSAPVSYIYKSIGSDVEPGQIILELDNSDIKAQLQQAEASLNLAKGQYEISGQSNTSAKSSAIDKVRDSYVKGYDVIISQIDTLLFNNDGNGGRLTSRVVDSRLNDRIINSRVDLTSIFTKWKSIGENLNQNSTDQEIVLALKTSLDNLNFIDKLLGDISQALNESSRYATGDFVTFLTNWKTVISASRTTISNMISSVIAVESAFVNANSSYGSTAEAQVAVAEAGVRNLEAQLAKTIIRSPIRGRVASVVLDIGELATPGQLIATVIGEQSLQVKAYASGDDLSRIKVGAKVNIYGQEIGVVESVAPSISNTNRKVEVKIDIDESLSTSTQKKLTIGQSVPVLIRAQNTNQISNTNLQSSNIYKLPIQDVKILPGEAFVLTVDELGKIKKNSVILGKVDGDFIEVISGLNDEMSIVTPVYELDEGESVEIE